MRSVVWSLAALDDLEAMIRYVAADSPGAATMLADRIDAATLALRELPTGRQGRVAGTYEKIVRRTPYIIAYALSDDRVAALRVIHGSRDWPEGDWPGR